MNETTTGGVRTATLPKTKSTLIQRSKLLENFYESIGMKDHLDVAESVSESQGVDRKPLTAIDKIDDPSRSTLKLGHHKRYLHLTSNSKQTSKRILAQRKELGKLNQMVSNEQALYRLAVDKFHDSYKSKHCECLLPMGMLLRASDQSRMGNNNRGRIEDSDIAKYYGKVRQTVALHYRRQQSSLDVQDLTCSVVYQSTPKSVQSQPPSSLPVKLLKVSLKDVQDGSAVKLSPPTKHSAPRVTLLRNDARALELAAKYSASIVTTAETLETLLQLPGHHSSKWLLPCTTERVEAQGASSISLTILDLPIAQAFSSPRSCLEKGLQEGVYQAFLKQSQPSQAAGATKNGSNEQDEQLVASQFVYSLWTLPMKNAGGASGSRTPTRVLIRTLVRLRDSKSKLPVRMRARVEYFSTPVHAQGKSRREIPNSYEKSLWILDQVLFGHQVFGLQYRIDPTTCEIVGWDTTSVAHAFAASATDNVSKKSQSDTTSPLDHWKTLIHLLQSIPSIDVPDSLLCLPGLIGEKKNAIQDTLEGGTTGTALQQQIRLDPFSVSVHGSCDDPNSKSQESSQPHDSLPGTISLDKSVLDRAGAVLLGDQALRDCRREWEWDRNGQVPNTFPVLEEDTEKEAK
eukprot:CAMPEP_0116077316 /NCGR_PEP_ID=MMETSP0327-20121206/5_1 /TAXON_ID=44447 /ORGANISM="Pseudo-nitzschia delicatissima, Strain B596" /LENGTH=628 /DNA_ID=CAMNT_0003567789 /DNA_START=41 /DNA_END=1928 /DNA_ORIENTATION=-